ncbi:MAG: hypothetical protein ABSH16_06435 [Sedimentisphaerales bacterium]
MSVIDELFAVATKLTEHSNKINDQDFNGPLDKLEKAANEIGKAWSGSWLGYHSRVYYEGLDEPPPRAHFSQEWGLMDTFAVQGSVGNWVEYRFGDVIDAINRIAGNPNINKQEKQSAEAQEYFEEAKYKILSCFSIISESRPNDKFIEDLREKVGKQKILYAKDFIRGGTPSRTVSRDSTAVGQGFQTPPHISVLASIHALRQPLIACGELSKMASRLASHLKNQKEGTVKDKKEPAKTGHRSIEVKEEQELEPKPPEFLQKLLWLRKHGIRYRKLLLVAILVMFVLLLFRTFVWPQVKLLGDRFIPPISPTKVSDNNAIAPNNGQGKVKVSVPSPVNETPKESDSYVIEFLSLCAIDRQNDKRSGIDTVWLQLFDGNQTPKYDDPYIFKEGMSCEPNLTSHEFEKNSKKPFITIRLCIKDKEEIQVGNVYPIALKITTERTLPFKQDSELKTGFRRIEYSLTYKISQKKGGS